MATASQKPRLSRADSDRKVASPLEQLRGIIRFYVTAEGLAALVVYVALCFWVGLLLDFGVFKVTGLDWIQVLGRPFRGAVLACLILGLATLITVKVAGRLLREFRAAALALLLERRFPNLLGDRLITAVELADPKKAARYGYSQAMIDQTVQDAADRVGQAPVREVFNWRRLTRYAILSVVLTLGLYLVIAGGYCGLQRAFAEQPDSLGTFAQRFNQVAGIWFERNVLLRNVPWPRHALLVIQDFPEEEKRIGRDAPAMVLNVQAYKWVIVDPDTDRNPDGWRPLRWGDLGRFLSAVPSLNGDLRPPKSRDADVNDLTLDELELHLKRREDLPSATAQPVRDVFTRLEELAAAIPMQRTLRKLEIPDDTRLIYKGVNLNNEQSLEGQNDNRYTCTLPELKENIRFWVRGADYVTPTKRITVEPPPELRAMFRDEDQPAYLYYSLPRTAPTDAMKGKRQQIRKQPVSVVGDTCRLDVPFGTRLALTAEADKDLVAVTLKPVSGIQASHKVEKLDEHGQPVQDGRSTRSFRVEFPTVTATIDFIFEMKDQYNVVGYHHVVIKPVEDLAPEVDVQVEVVRKTNQGYLITPRAMVYFSGKLKDDHGIAQAEYRYALTRLEAQPAGRLQALLTARVIGWQGLGPLRALAALAHESKFARPNGEENEQPPASAALKTLDSVLRDKERLVTPLARLDELLRQAPPDRHERDRTFLKEFVLDPDTEFFDVEKLGLRTSEEGAPIIRYRLRLWVQAHDANIETGPSKGESKEKFSLFIVTEDELLTEIAKEEESLNAKLDDAVSRLKDARLKLEKVISDLPGLKDDELKPVSRWTVDTGEVAESIVKTGDTAREVLGDYRRILKELQANRVQPGMISRVRDRIVEPLELAARDDFPRAEESCRAFLKSLRDGKKDMPAAQKAMNDLSALLGRLDSVLEAMEGITTINKLIAELVKLEQDEVKGLQELAALKKKKEDELLKLLTGEK